MVGRGPSHADTQRMQAVVSQGLVGGRGEGIFSTTSGTSMDGDAGAIQCHRNGAGFKTWCYVTREIAKRWDLLAR